MLFEARDLCVGYGGAPAISGVSIEVDEGEIVSVIGPNGAGKSTLINAIAGLLDWQEGTIRLAGIDMKSVPPHLVCAQGIALVPEGRRLFPGMSVEENLDIGCYRPEARKRRTEGLERAYTLFPVLRERRHQLAGTLSGGQQQMVAIARALMAQPRLLLLDEPSLGLAPAIVSDMFRVIRVIQEEGVAILLVEQNVGQAMEIADRAYVLEEGKIVASGLPHVLLAQSRIREAYLGL
ncbi:MAG TPA: ABC transporter ATP-binding protein [Stellaceae bacterium]|nr:ABC transporter ATP-binding protein [Stellaceae bacterium]